MNYWDMLPPDIHDRIYAMVHQGFFKLVMGDLVSNVYVTYHKKHYIFDECYIVSKCHLGSECSYMTFHNGRYNVLSCINIGRGLSWLVGEFSPVHRYTQVSLRTPEGTMQNTGVFAHYWIKRKI